MKLCNRKSKQSNKKDMREFCFTPAALPNILKCLKDERYEFVFISDLILKDNYEIKHDGTQCKLKDGAE